jgi:hypothetical protein
LAAAATAALGAASAANATTYFTATSSSGSSISMSELLFTSFNNGFYDVRFAGQCNTCITATSGGGTALGTFNLALNGSPWSYIQDPYLYPNNGTLAYAGGSEVYGGFGSVSITNGASNLVSGFFDYATIFATPGASTATVQFKSESPNLFTSNAVSLGSGPLYLIITGATSSPVSLNPLVDAGGVTHQTYAPMTIDYTVTLTDTPFTPGTGGTGGNVVPEPGTWALLLLGAGATGLALRRRRTVRAGEPCIPI